MTEKTIQIERIHPLELFGANEKKLSRIRKSFPELKLIARGNSIKAIGKKSEISRFEKKLEEILSFFEHYNRLTERDISNLLAREALEGPKKEGGREVLVYGNNGLKVVANTINQQKIVDSYKKNDMIFAIGPAGSGKTYTAVALAVRALKNKEVKKIILTRPAVEAGENLGFLPGDLKEKLDPYLQPLYDALRDMIPPEKLKGYLEDGTIEIAPLAFMRGRTLDKAFAILDEAQNATTAQLKMFLTRMGQSAKFMITGDVTQIDLPNHQSSGLVKSMQVLKKIPGIDVIELDANDVIRHKLVTKVLQAFEKEEL